MAIAERRFYDAMYSVATISCDCTYASNSVIDLRFHFQLPPQALCQRFRIIDASSDEHTRRAPLQ